MREALVEGIDAGVDHVARRIEVGLTDLKVDDVVALGFEGAGTHQDFESGFRSEAGHATRQVQLTRSFRHKQTHNYTLDKPDHHPSQARADAVTHGRGCCDLRLVGGEGDGGGDFGSLGEHRGDGAVLLF
jgi:hypothetical protein